eukprot:3463379-Prorocentrum_lima.AAC.1
MTFNVGTLQSDEVAEEQADQLASVKVLAAVLQQKQIDVAGLQEARFKHEQVFCCANYKFVAVAAQRGQYGVALAIHRKWWPHVQEILPISTLCVRVKLRIN